METLELQRMKILGAPVYLKEEEMEQMINVKIREGASFSRVVVTESNGNRSAAYVPESIGAEDPRVVSGDVNIVLAAAIAWDGTSEEFDISEEDLEKFGGGYWSR